MNPPRPLASLPLSLLLLAVAGCSPHASNGSMKVAAGHPAVLTVTAPGPGSTDLKVFNKGPQPVRFERLKPDGDGERTGELPADGGARTWSVAAGTFELQLVVATGEAVVGYSAAGGAGFSVSMTAK